MSIIPLQVRGQTLYLSTLDLPSDEEEIAAVMPTLDHVMGGISAFAEEMIDKLRDLEVSKLCVEFGCEFAIESGKLVAVVGKASAKSTVKVALEWSKPS